MWDLQLHVSSTRLGYLGCSTSPHPGLGSVGRFYHGVRGTAAGQYNSAVLSVGGVVVVAFGGFVGEE